MKNDASSQYIRIIAETHSISAAAAKLGISQPALSAYLKKLEVRLGVALFDRSVLPIRITEAGKAYLDYIDGVNELFVEFQKKIGEGKNEEQI